MKREEVWRPVTVCQEGLYEVSDHGRVYSVRSRRVILQYETEKGYKEIKLYVNGACLNARIHRLVALAFIENPEGFPQVNHLDGIRSNNEVSNLEWCTGSMNMKHAASMGSLHARTNPKKAQKLTPEKVDSIIRLRSLGLTYKELMNEFGVGVRSITEILNGKRWANPIQKEAFNGKDSQH